MSDYGQRGHDSGSEGYGWASGGSHSGRHSEYEDFSDLRGGGSDAGATARVPSPHDEPLTSGRAQVQGAGAPEGGAARGSARVGAKRNGDGLSESEATELEKSRKKRKRRRKLLALACVLVMFLGIGTVAGTLFFDSQPTPDTVSDRFQSTIVKHSDGSPMAKIGGMHSNRRNIKISESDNPKDPYAVPKDVRFALLAMEDQKFYTHEGVDFMGVVRAFWNNVTGGEQQGASTLTQQYVGQAEKMRDDKTYMRKAREAVMAMKMDDTYDKNEIIEFYMNLVFMGRGSYGLGTAAEAWFGTTPNKLTASQAALIFAQVKNPSGVYDPRHPDMADKEAAEGRWKYCLKAMLSKKWLSPTEYEKFMDEGMPTTEKYKVGAGNEGQAKSTGFVSHGQLMYEAKEKAGLSENKLQTGGYEITTTIKPKLQEAAVKAASREKGKGMDGQDDRLRAGLVSVDPRNGEVVAYFGGSEDGSTDDKAASLHPPGSAFKEFTMMAALKDGISLDSMWDGSTPRTFEGRETPVKNAEEDANHPYISLSESIRKSLNTSVYAVTQELGADKVAKMASEMGIRKMNGKDGKTLELVKDKEVAKQLESGSKRAPFDNEVGFGQYPVSITDMASATATLAGKGQYVEPHFIKEIKNNDGETVYNAEEEENLEKHAALEEDQAADGAWVASDIVPDDMNDQNKLGNGQEVAGKSGTWEYDCDAEGADQSKCNENSNIWFTGFQPNLSAAVWVGDKSKENGIVQNPDGSPAFGAQTSGSVWHSFMEEASKVEDYDEPVPLPGKAGTGDKGRGDGKKPEDDKEDDKEKCKPDDQRPECPDEGEEDPGTGKCDPMSPGDWPDCDDDGEPCPQDPDDPDCESGGGDGGDDGGDGGDGGDDGDCPITDPNYPNCPRNNENDGGGGYSLLGTPVYANRPEDAGRDADADAGRKQTSTSGP